MGNRRRPGHDLLDSVGAPNQYTAIADRGFENTPSGAIGEANGALRKERAVCVLSAAAALQRHTMLALHGRETSRCFSAPEQRRIFVHPSKKPWRALSEPWPQCRARSVRVQ